MLSTQMESIGMLSFNLTNNGQAIQVHCDSVGMGELIRALGNLIQERGGHVHLCAPSGGGKILNDVSPFGEPAIGEVIIDYFEGDPTEED